MFKLANDRYPVLCLSFSSNSEYLASGSEGGQIQIWDLRQRKMYFEICEDEFEHITAVAWNYNDALLTAVTSKGLLYVINIASRVIQEKLQYDTAAIRCLKFSKFKHSLVATGGDNGIVTVWDIKNSTLYHAFERSSHSDVCTGVVFSPMNDLLLCSAGLDAKIQFFDIKDKRNVKTIEANEQVSCLSFFQDGVTIAAGTLSGLIYIHNLKDSNVKMILKGHEGFAVRWLEFKYLPKPRVKAKEEKKIKTYDEIREEAKTRIPIENKMKKKVENTKVPAKTSSRSMVKPTLQAKAKNRNEDYAFNEPIQEDRFEESNDDFESKESYNNEPQDYYLNDQVSVVQNQGPAFNQSQKNFLNEVIDQKLLESQMEFSDLFSNLQLEMMRQFMIQQEKIQDTIVSKIENDY